MKPFAIAPNTGGTLDTADIIGRDETSREVLSRLSAGNNLRVADPRRMGKTTLLQRLDVIAPEFKDRVITVVVVDFQGTSSTDEFLDRLISHLAEHATFGDRFRKAAKDLIEKSGIQAQYQGWTFKPTLASVPRKSVMLQMLSSIEEKLAEDETIVLACDEVPIAVERIAEVAGISEGHLLLDVLQHSRRAGRRVRWLLTGSIGFHHIARRVGATEAIYGDVETQALGPLAPEFARHLAECLLLGVDRAGDPETAARMAEITGAIPFFLHHLAHGLTPGEGPASVADADAAFDAFVNDRDRSSALTHLVTRLDGYYGEDTALAMKVLDYLAGVTSPVGFATLARNLKLTGVRRDRLVEVVDWLVDDHYLASTSQGVAWRYEVLRHVWFVRRRLG